MGDAKQILVGSTVDVADAEAMGERAIAWLTKHRLLGKVQLMDRMEGNPFEGPAKTKVVRDKKTWRPGPEVLGAVEPQSENVFDFRRRDPNHVELRAGREVYTQEGARCTCPNCGEQLQDWWELTNGWRDTGAVTVACPSCARPCSVTDLRFDPSGAAGALAIVFWNWWPLRPSVVDALSKELGHRLVLVWDFD